MRNILSYGDLRESLLRVGVVVGISVFLFLVIVSAAGVYAFTQMHKEQASIQNQVYGEELGDYTPPTFIHASQVISDIACIASEACTAEQKQVSTQSFASYTNEGSIKLNGEPLTLTELAQNPLLSQIPWPLLDHGMKMSEDGKYSASARVVNPVVYTGEGWVVAFTFDLSSPSKPIVLSIDVKGGDGVQSGS